MMHILLWDVETSLYTSSSSGLIHTIEYVAPGGEPTKIECDYISSNIITSGEI